jgi:6-phosphogluconolactonase
MGAGGDGTTLANDSASTNQHSFDAAEDGSLFLVSSYTDISVLAHTPKGNTGTGITSLHLDAKTGRLTSLSTTPLGPNPAFLVQHPKLPHLVYATTECIQGDGDVNTLELNKDGQLNLLARQSARGKSTCYVNLQLESGYMVLVNYWDAKLSTLPMNKAGTVGEPTEVLQQPEAQYCQTHNPTREEHWTYRQRWPHSHCCVTEPYSQQTLFVCDLGLDRIFAYELDAEQGKLAAKAEVQLQKGRGPRHLVFHPSMKCAYVGNELESTITVLKLNDHHLDVSAGYTVHNAKDCAALLHEVQTVSCLPADFQNEGFVTPAGVWKAASHTSEIRIHPSGRWVYIGNRGHDSIAVFAVDEVSGHLTLVAITPSGGKCPRNFNFDRTGRYMVVGNQDTNTLNVFEICQATGTLSETHVMPLPSPNFVYAVPASLQSQAVNTVPVAEAAASAALH